MDRVHRICRQSNGGHGSTGSGTDPEWRRGDSQGRNRGYPQTSPGFPIPEAERIAREVAESVPPKSAPTILDKIKNFRVKIQVGPVERGFPLRFKRPMLTSILPRVIPPTVSPVPEVVIIPVIW